MNSQSSQSSPQLHALKPHHERRRHPRLAMSVPLKLRTAEGEQTLMTSDISRAGVFVRTDTKFERYQLVRILVRLPTIGEEISVLALVARVVRPDSPEGKHSGPGVGLSFYSIDMTSQDAWDGFVAATEADQRNDTHHVVPRNADKDFVEPVRRAHPRIPLEMSAHLETDDALYACLTSDISIGGSFLHTDESLEVGEQVRVFFIHPMDESEFVADATVVRRGHDRNGGAGLGLCFEPLSIEQTCHLELFLRTARFAHNNHDSEFLS